MEQLSFWRRYSHLLVVLLAPCLLLPVFFIPAEAHDSPKKFKCAYVILLMAIFWITEALPLAVTALLPVVLFPLLDIQGTDAVCLNYMRESVMMFLAGLCLALSIEYCGLHKRIALRTMLLVGTSPWRLLLGLMVTSFFLSCWIIINTAVVAMMIPIITGLLEDLPETRNGGPNNRQLTKLFMLAVGYASNIGGTAVIIGSNPNLVAKGLLTAENIGQDGKYTEINFTTWIAYAMPIALLNSVICFVYLGCVFIGRPQWREVETNSSRAAVKTLRNKLDALGPLTFHEICVLFIFVTVMSLWFTNDPQIFTGWSTLFEGGHVKVGDSTIALAFVLLMFVLPKSSTPGSGTLLDWTFVQRNLPWNVVLLVGGGFAISDGASVSGLSAWIGVQLSGLDSLPNAVLSLLSLLIISCLTEVLSNAATVQIMLPILITISKQLDLHPLYLSLPGAIASQFAFMLPVSNPTNAIVFTAGRMRILDMVRAGAVLNVACLVVLWTANLGWGQVIFNYSDYVYVNKSMSQ